LGFTKVALAIHMTNPAKIGQHAKMEDLLAAQALKDKASQAAKRKATNADSEGKESKDIGTKEWHTINI
jgi:hypothetical protein